MRKINLIVIHCSATCEDRPFTGQALEAAHRRRGFDGTGYHFYIRRDGQILTTRPVERAAPTPAATMPLYRNRLRRWIGPLWESQRHTHGMAAPLAPRTGPRFADGLSGSKSGGTSRPQPRPEQQRRGGTDGMDETMPVF